MPTSAASREGRGWSVYCAAPGTHRKCGKRTVAHSDPPLRSSPHRSTQKRQRDSRAFLLNPDMRQDMKVEGKTKQLWGDSHSAYRGYISSGRRRWTRGGCVPPVLECTSLGKKTGLARHWSADRRIVAGRGCGWRSWTWWPHFPGWTLSA